MRRIGLSPSTCGNFEDDGCVRITKASMRKSPRVDGSRGDRERSPMLNFSQFDVMTFDCYGTMIDWEAGITAAATAIAAGHDILSSPERILALYGELEPAIPEDHGARPTARLARRELVREDGVVRREDISREDQPVRVGHRDGLGERIHG